MSSNLVETVIGALVIIIAGLFLSYAYSHSDIRRVSGYPLSARFDHADGILPGTDVRVSGIKIGTVTRADLDPKTFQAVVMMEIKPEIQLPADSSLKVATEGLLGGEFLSVEPGGAEDMIKPGGQIQFTQGSIDIIGLVMKTMFGSGGGAQQDHRDGAPPLAQKPEAGPQK